MCARQGGAIFLLCLVFVFVCAHWFLDLVAFLTVPLHSLIKLNGSDYSALNFCCASLVFALEIINFALIYCMFATCSCFIFFFSFFCFVCDVVVCLNLDRLEAKEGTVSNCRRCRLFSVQGFLRISGNREFLNVKKNTSTQVHGFYLSWTR